MTNWKQGYPEIKEYRDPYFWSRVVLVKTSDGFILEGEAILDKDGKNKWYLRATDQIEELDDIVGWMEIPQ